MNRWTTVWYAYLYNLPSQCFFVMNLISLNIFEDSILKIPINSMLVIYHLTYNNKSICKVTLFILFYFLLLMFSCWPNKMEMVYMILQMLYTASCCWCISTVAFVALLEEQACPIFYKVKCMFLWVTRFSLQKYINIKTYYNDIQHIP